MFEYLRTRPWWNIAFATQALALIAMMTSRVMVVPAIEIALTIGISGLYIAAAYTLYSVGRALWNHFYPQPIGANAPATPTFENGIEIGQSLGHELGLTEGRRLGHEAGLREGHGAGVREGHEAGFRDGNEAGLRAGRVVGFQEGREEGLREGHEAGVQAGREIGIQFGRALGLRQGRAEGIEQGREEGFEEGHEAGLQEGLQQAQKGKEPAHTSDSEEENFDPIQEPNNGNTSPYHHDFDDFDFGGNDDIEPTPPENILPPAAPVIIVQGPNRTNRPAWQEQDCLGSMSVGGARRSSRLDTQPRKNYKI